MAALVLDEPAPRLLAAQERMESRDAAVVDLNLVVRVATNPNPISVDVEPTHHPILERHDEVDHRSSSSASVGPEGADCLPGVNGMPKG